MAQMVGTSAPYVRRLINKKEGIIMLFFASFFPYVTSFVSYHFTSLFAQMFYSMVVICVSLSNMALGRAGARANGSTSALDYSNRKIVAADLSIKTIGSVLALFVYPPIAMLDSETKITTAL